MSSYGYGKKTARVSRNVASMDVLIGQPYVPESDFLQTLHQPSQDGIHGSISFPMEVHLPDAFKQVQSNLTTITSCNNMTTRKRNEWLEDPASDSEDLQSDREDSDTRAFISRNTKRRKLDEESADDYESEEQDLPNYRPITLGPTSNTKPHSSAIVGESRIEAGDGDAASENQLEEEDEQDDEDEHDHDIQSQPQPTSKSSLSKKLAKSTAKTKKTGVVYISRVPPFMKPFALKHLLSPHAPSGINRIFLTPETTQSRQSRLKSGGNKKKSYTDGWIEFVSKREAKVACELLNARSIGGKGYYRDDVWNLKYLRGGFKWRHLTEQIANENAERGARVRAEDARERKSVREFLGNVERGKMIEGMERKNEIKAGRTRKGGGDGEGGEEVDSIRKLKTVEPRRTFAQVKVRSSAGKGRDGVAEPSADAKRVLSKIF